MPRHATALLTACLLAATAGTAAAKPVSYDDDYDRDVDRSYDDEVSIASASAVAFRVPTASGSFDSFGEGAGLSLSWIDAGGDFPSGFEADAIFVAGDEGGQFYDLGLSIIGSGRLGNNLAVPFASVGLDVSGVSIPTANGDAEGGLALGVHGNIGLHGFLSDDVYWRGQVGYLGAALGGIKAQVSVGWVFGRD